MTEFELAEAALSLEDGEKLPENIQQAAEAMAEAKGISVARLFFEIGRSLAAKHTQTTPKY